MLVWQQPHPVYLAELVYRAHKDRATLDRYKQIVFETADYMATIADGMTSGKQVNQHLIKIRKLKDAGVLNHRARSVRDRCGFPCT